MDAGSQPYRCAWFVLQPSGSRFLASEPQHAELSDDELRKVAREWAIEAGIDPDGGYVVIGRSDQ